MYGLTLTYVITAIGAIGALRYPLLGLYVYVGFGVLRPQAIWGFAGDLSHLSEIVGVAMLIGWAFQGFGSWRLGRGRAIVVTFLAFVAWFALSASQARDSTRAFEQLRELSKIVLPFLVGVTMMKTEDDWRRLLWTIVLAQGYVSLEMNMDYLLKGRNTAALGFGGVDNNYLGVSMLTVLGPAIALMLSSTKWYGRCLAGGVVVLILHTILLTFSRGAMVGLLALGATAFVMMPKRPKYVGAMLLLTLLAVRLTGPELWERYATTFASEEERDASAQGRVELWLDCLEVISDHPVLGIGPSNWRAIAVEYGWTEGKSAHSVWMETAAETGIPGVLALILFFGWALLRLWPIARARLTDSNRYEVILASGVVLSIVGFAVSAQFVSAGGMEVPYYVVMLGTVLLKSTKREGVAAARTNVAPQLPYRTAPAGLRPLPAGRAWR